MNRKPGMVEQPNELAELLKGVFWGAVIGAGIVAAFNVVVLLVLMLF